MDNINTIDRVENQVNIEFHQDASRLVQEDVVEYTLFGASNAVDNPALEFEPEIDESFVDNNGYFEQQYDEIIGIGQQFIDKTREFKEPIYTDLIPTMKNYIQYLKNEKLDKFPPVPPPEPVQSTIHQFMHYRQ